ncbi:MAG: hypothetical protein OXC60_15165 [Litoreibacter sp.]|nr:hypothetical protein [Litoreibacter sp.]MCY4335997.1 hypothetical protein [Litoreibacter sp.]
MAQKVLDLLCDEVAGCKTAAFVDLSTRMVLVTNGTNTESQDTLNEMCQEAELMLVGGDTAMVATSGHMRLYLRDDAEPNDALCCVCETDTNFPELIAKAKACLSEISNVSGND